VRCVWLVVLPLPGLSTTMAGVHSLAIMVGVFGFNCRLPLCLPAAGALLATRGRCAHVQPLPYNCGGAACQHTQEVQHGHEGTRVGHSELHKRERDRPVLAARRWNRHHWAHVTPTAHARTETVPLSPSSPAARPAAAARGGAPAMSGLCDREEWPTAAPPPRCESGVEEGKRTRPSPAAPWPPPRPRRPHPRCPPGAATEAGSTYVARPPRVGSPPPPPPPPMPPVPSGGRSDDADTTCRRGDRSGAGSAQQPAPRGVAVKPEPPLPPHPPTPPTPPGLRRRRGARPSPTEGRQAGQPAWPPLRAVQDGRAAAAAAVPAIPDPLCQPREGTGGPTPTAPAARLFPPGAPTVDAAAAAMAARRAGERPDTMVHADGSVGNAEADAARRRRGPDTARRRPPLMPAPAPTRHASTAVAQVAAASAAVGHRCRRRDPRRCARPQRPTPHGGSATRRAAATVAAPRAARARPLGAAATAAAAAPTAGVWSAGAPPPDTLRQPRRPRDTAAVGSTAARAARARCR